MKLPITDKVQLKDTERLYLTRQYLNINQETNKDTVFYIWD